jgi:hypothetical protein
MWLVRLFQEIAGRLNRLAGFAILVFIFLMMGLLEADEFKKGSHSSTRAEAPNSSKQAPKSPPNFADTCWCVRYSVFLRALPSGVSPCSRVLNPRRHGACSLSRQTESPFGATLNAFIDSIGQ